MRRRGPKKKGPQALGRSRGGFGTKAHAAVNAKGHPVALKLTPGQSHDAPHAPDLLAAARRGATKAVLGDRAYDTDAILALVRRLQARVVIPADGGRVKPRRYDRTLYKGRNVVERYWNKVKQYRRVATRYDKLDQCFLAFVHLASILVVLKHP